MEIRVQVLGSSRAALMPPAGARVSEQNAETAAPVGFSLRLLSACSGSFATALVVTPLDVAKVQMQAAETTREARVGVSAVQHIGCRQFVCSNGISEHYFDKRDRCWRRCFRQQPLSKTIGASKGSTQSTLGAGTAGRPQDGLFRTLRVILSQEGPRGLYAGLPATLVLAIPSNVLYFATYESMRDGLRSRSSFCSKRSSKSDGMLAPIIAGGTARLVSATVCAPIEIVRTRVQAARLVGATMEQRKGLTVLRNLVREQGTAALFRGLESTLWRDVPFSAFYWAGVETIRAALVQRGWWKDSRMQAPLTSIIAGASAGGIAAFVTTPFDVVKTRRQVETLMSSGSSRTGCASPGSVGCAYAVRPECSGAAMVARPVVAWPWTTAATSSWSPSLWGELQRVVREEGAAALMTGATPRVARVTPACAIMLGTYELTKLIFQP